MNEAFRIGVDVGGTFTDLVLLSETTGDMFTLKVSSTPADPSQAVLNAVERTMQETGLDLSGTLRFSHGTTVATNAILEGVGAATGLIVTEGFRDVLEIQRHKRYELFNLDYQKIKPLVPRERAHGIPGRIDAKGEVVTELDEDALRGALEELKADKVGAIAICFLFSFLNPSHERRAAEIAREILPDCYISISSEILPQFREYERASTTAVNAYLGPRVQRYFDRMQRELKSAGLEVPLFIMQSNGGTITADEAKLVPSRIVESGPAAGVIGASFYGSQVGRKSLIAFDMGGTTAKAGLVENGQPTLAAGQEVGGGINVSRINQGGGYYVGSPTVDLAEVSSGGGSISWVNQSGILKVGPQSAGAAPGPVCYGTGGKKVTVTDANVLLGRIPSDYFLGGEMPLNVEAARQAVQDQIAGPLSLSIENACAGILDIANANMLTMLRIISVEKGFDPREYSMVVSGGAGPVQGVFLADEIGMTEVIVPPSPGLLSALGLLVADVRYEFRQTHVRDLAIVDLCELQSIYDELETRGREALAQNGVAPEAMVIERAAELRYERQAFELSIDVPDGPLDEATRHGMAESFHISHARKYGRDERESAIKLVNPSLSARGAGQLPPMRRLSVGDGSGASALKGHRQVFFRETGFIECPCYERKKLLAGDSLQGPLIVEASDSTTVVPGGWEVLCDDTGNLFVTKGKRL